MAVHWFWTIINYQFKPSLKEYSQLWTRQMKYFIELNICEIMAIYWFWITINYQVYLSFTEYDQLWTRQYHSDINVSIFI